MMAALAHPLRETATEPILVVDDDPFVRALFVRALRRAGHATLEAADGVEALAVLARNSVALVLLDATMPRLNGAGVIRVLRARPATRTLPIILVTGKADPEDRVEGLATGADDYLCKPVALEELKARVGAQLRSHAAWTEALEREGAERREAGGTRQQGAALHDLIAAHAFTTYFQPVVTLADGALVGYEALTRFSDGVRPDVRFAEATRLGLGHELERATLRAALEAVAELPDSASLALNVSPSFVLAAPDLPALVSGSGRAIVLEITEHAAVDNYGALRVALARFGPRVQVAVDDAGSGYASLRHILALRPAIVKLDIGWVHGIESDPARHALVTGLVHFATEAGCQLLGEGVETEAERTTLLGLGVTLGQGYLFGRPAPVLEAAAIRASR